MLLQCEIIIIYCHPPSCDCVPEVANIRKTGQEKDEEGTWNCYYYCMYVPALIITGLL